jgi:hypothetical protein
MMYYKSQNFTNVAYGADRMDTWFKGGKPGMIEKNACVNLPYIADGSEVVTQSNTCRMCGAAPQSGDFALFEMPDQPCSRCSISTCAPARQ